MYRVVEQELLDLLPVDDHRAIGSRSDLRRMNRLMGHARIIASCLERIRPSNDVWNLAEIGAGDGTFALSILQQLQPKRRPCSATLVDRVSLVDNETREKFSDFGCAVAVIRADVFNWIKSAPPATVIVANLFLHHFGDGELSHLLESIAERCSTFVACEPGRSRLNLGASRLIGLCGCNCVTRHDALASVRAGFAGKDLSSLWPGTDSWTLEERGAGFFSHLFAARHASQHHANLQAPGRCSDGSSVAAR